MPIDGGRIVSYLELDTSGYQDAMSSAHNMLLMLQSDSVGLGAKLDSLGGFFQRSGAKLTLGLTAPLLAAGGAAGKAAISFESAFAGVRKTVDATEAEYAALSEEIRALSREIPQSATSLAGIMEIAGQLGVDQGNLLGFTETIANLGVATNLSGEEAATMLAQYANIMDMPLSDIERLGSVIVDLGNHCATTEKDITEMAQRLAGTGSLLGLSSAQVMGLSATMASLGINAEAGGSAMSRTLQTMNSAVLSGGRELESFSTVAGVTAQAFAQAFQADPLQALDSFLRGLGEINAAGGDAAGALEEVSLSDLRITDTLLRMSGAQGSLAENIALANGAWNENNALQEEAGKRYATTESQLQLAKNSVTNMASSLGELLLPLVARGADLVGQAADGIASLDEGTKRLILTSAGVLAAIGPVTTALGSLLKIVSSPVGLVAALGLAGAAGVKALSDMRQAAVDAELAQRFGEVSLSAQEMDEVIGQLLGRNTTFEALLADADNALRMAREQLSASAQAMDKLWIKTQLGYDVDDEQLTQAAQQLTLDISDVIEAQSVKANMTVDALFGADDPDGTKIKSDFDLYFSKLDAEATSVGLELAWLINDALVDGIVDADEQAAIQAQYEHLNSIKTGVVAMEAKGAQLRFDMEARQTELTPESLAGLMARGNALMQANVDLVKQRYEEFYTLTTNMAAMEGKAADDPELLARLDVARRARDEGITAAMADNAASLWESVGSRIVGGYDEELRAAQVVAEQAWQQAKQSTEAFMRDQTAVQPGGEGWAELYQRTFANKLPDFFASAGWGEIIDDTALRGVQQMYESLEPLHGMVRQLAQEQGDALAPELRDALGQLNFFEMLASDLPMQAGSRYAEDYCDQLYEAGLQSGQAAVEGAREGMREGMEAQAGEAPQWRADVLTKVWQLSEGRVGELTGSLGGGMGEALSAAMRDALNDAYARMANEGIDPANDSLRLADELRDSLREQLQAVGWEQIVTPQMQQDAQTMYASLAPLHDTLRNMAQAMGNDMPAVLRDALGQLDLLQLMTLDADVDLPQQLAQAMKAGREDAQSAGREVADSAVEGLTTAQDGAAEAGSNAGAGFVQGASGYMGQAYQAGYSTALAYVQGAQQGLDAHSPSRETARLGRFAVAGFTGALNAGRADAYGAGYAMARSVLEGVAQGQDSHSPSKAMASLGVDGAAGYVEGYRQTVAANRAALSGEMSSLIGTLGGSIAQGIGGAAAALANAEAARRQAAAAAQARAAAEEAARAEAARQQAILDGINRTAAATLAADTAAYNSRMGAIARQTQSLMDFAGAHAIWYQDDKGETQTQAARDRYDALIAQEKARYEAQAATLATDEQRKAAKKAYDDRVALLKKQRDAEIKALQDQYSLQKNMAVDWLNAQKELLSQELAARRAAYAEEDYQDELAELQKRQRQSKSAREKRELQEQIDKMIRDHALEQEEAALRETLAGYDALIEAVNAGLIGLGDLTGNSAFGNLSFGTAGLAALDNLTADQLAAVLGSLRPVSLSDGTGATVSAAQLAAALASAGQSSSMPTVINQGGNQYTIDLRGALVRDDDDITRIVDELEARMRAAKR